AGYPTLHDLAAGFANWINAEASLAEYTAVAEGDALLIVKRSSGSFVTSVTVTAAGSVLASTTTPAAGQVFTLALAGTPAAGETWSVSVGGQSVSATVSASANTTLAKIAETLAATIRDHASLSAFTAAAKGVSLVIVEETSALASAPTLAVTPASSIAAAAAPSAFMLDLTGTAVVDDSWRVTLNGTSYSVTVGSFVNLGNGLVVVDTLTEVAQALAKAINAAGGSFAATVEDTRLIIAGPAGASLVTSYLPSAASAASPAGWGTASSAATAAYATLSGTPVAGDIFRVSVGAVSFAHTVTTGEGREAVALALAQLINDSSDPLAAGFSAIGDGNLLVIVRRSGGAIVPVCSLTKVATSAVARAITVGSGATTSSANTLSLSGSSYFGKVWSVTLDDGTSSRTASYAAGLVDRFGNPDATGVDMRMPTLSEIATLLAAAINAQAQADFSALAEGNQVVIVNRAGTAFTATYAVATAGTMTATTLSATAQQATIAAGVRAGDQFTASVAVGAASASVTYTAQAGDIPTRVAAALAALLNSSADPDAAEFSATARGASLYIVNRGQLVFTSGYTFVPATLSAVSTATGKSAVIDATGSSVVADESWTLTLTAGSTVTTYTVATASTDLQTVLAGLAVRINADSANAYLADASGSVLRVFRSGSTDFTASLSIVAAGVPAVDPATVRTEMHALTGVAVSGESWRLTLAGRNYSVAVDATNDTLAKIATALAGLVNADANADDFTASAESATLILTNRAGGALGATLNALPTPSQTVSASLTALRLELVGNPLAGERWTVTLAGRAYTVTADATT
ncbi:hypothetical protein JZU69_04155, partial [bacterium]|nr:hypothetical protein [bacterium]